MKLPFNIFSKKQEAPAEKIQSYKFHGSHSLIEAEELGVLQALRAQRPEFEGDAVSLEMLAQFDYMTLNQLDWARETLGLDLKSRIADFRKMRFLNEKDWIEYCAKNKSDCSSTGIFRHPSNLIILKLVPDKNDLRWNFNHEAVHNFSSQRLSIKRNESEGLDILGKTVGFLNIKNHTGLQLNETVTEMINIETFARYEKETSLQTPVELYSYMVIFLDMVLAKMATVLGETESSLRKKLYRSYFVGDGKFLTLVKKAFGVEAVKVLMDMPETRLPASFFTMIGPLHFGLDRATMDLKYKKFKDGEEIRLGNGLKLKLKKTQENGSGNEKN